MRHGLAGTARTTLCITTVSDFRHKGNFFEADIYALQILLLAGGMPPLFCLSPNYQQGIQDIHKPRHKATKKLKRRRYAVMTHYPNMFSSKRRHVSIPAYMPTCVNSTCITLGRLPAHSAAQSSSPHPA